MRFDVFIAINSVEKAISFYVNELAMFRLAHNYGNGNILLQSKTNERFCLSTIMKEADVPTSTRFAIQVKSANSEYERIKGISFSDEAGICPFYNGDEIVEYPLGISFCMKDPFGNEFSIFEEFYDFLGKDAKLES